jgi:large conductance mechanosensitive channel
MMKEFTDFLKQYGVIGLAVAVIIGGKLGDLVKAVVDGLLMPFIGALIPGGDWRGFTTPGPIAFELGRVAGAAIDFHFGHCGHRRAIAIGKGDAASAQQRAAAIGGR